ncbi:MULTISPECIES: serine O-acetyltransferase [Bacillus cereus group]|uniref:serine O-acetyltransferase n=1 Tax=Bacillus cereus group TaxID=86661 RepID=UPI001F5B2D34|nr:serine O-acetyltransferase [Bacillus cereus]
MKRKIKNIWFWLNIIRSVPAIVSFKTNKFNRIISKDIERWISIKNPISKSSSSLNLHWLMLNSKEFRNLFYYRINKNNFILSRVLKLFYRPLGHLYIYTEDIGEGFFIQHGFSTIITAKKIGKNCSVNQQVTIGWGSNGGIPTIGDNVLISSGAKVFGDISIGNNSKVGANCVVSKDVPDSCTVVGIPGRIIKKAGERVDIAL